jgi:UDP-3-O-[3-hydroxymyristoyl] N-acetylglucosamine deacetylase
MARARTTILEELSFDGVGIHSGTRSSVRLLPSDEGRGIAFAFGDKIYGVAEAEPDGSKRSTSLVFPGGERVRTVEHLLAAMAGVELSDALVIPDGEELPIMDGSPLPFAEAIMSAGLREFGSLPAAPSVAAPICVDWGASSIAALPSDELRLTYVIDYPGEAVGTEMKDVVMTRDVFMAEIAPARTFCMAGEAEALRRSGYGLGGNAGNVLVMDDEAPRSGYRVSRECAAHKAADLLGDLAASGCVPRAHYICVSGGHALHAKLVERIKRSVLKNSGR